jgi:hypothetical protein
VHNTVTVGGMKAQVCSEPVGVTDLKNISLSCLTMGRCEQQMIRECCLIFMYC